MTSEIRLWSPVPANNSAAPPVGSPENVTTISDLNDIQREQMAYIRQWYDADEYRDLNLALEPSGPADGVVLTGEQSSYFAVGQTVRWTDGGAGGTGAITAIDAAGNTTLTVNGTVTHPVSLLEVGTNIFDYDWSALDLTNVDMSAGDYSTAGLMALVSAATENNLATFDAAGQVQDGGAVPVITETPGDPGEFILPGGLTVKWGLHTGTGQG